MTKPTWSAGLRLFWWSGFVLFAATAIVLLVSAITTFTTRAKLEWQSAVAAIAPVGIVAWLVRVKRHPEEWLDAEGRSRFRW